MVPLPARGRGREGSVTTIISLNSRANVGARWLASSMTCLWPLSAPQATPLGRDIPDFVSELGEVDVVVHVYLVARLGLDEETALGASAPEHDGAANERARVDHALLWDRNHVHTYVLARQNIE